jgi:crotonobetainyl-CoA:carnitine CoA-transferase CaiB-like acyl-CoA transferase
MARDNILIPEQFGPLQGMRIVSTGFYLAQPFAASLAAEMGAEVIHVERPKVGDPYRMWRADGTHGYGFMQERRNMLCVTLDFSQPRGRDLFIKLLGETDIWMESSKPGSLAKFGLGDESVLKAHPRLIVTHVSGFGQSGDPDYVSRPAYDSIGQAFSGMMYQNGEVDRSPYRAQPDSGDYMTASYALWSSLAAYIRMLKSGKGQSIDVAIFEVVHKHLGPTMLEYFQEGIVRERHGNKSTFNQPMDCFRAKDGWMMIVAMFAQFDRLCELMGLDPRQWRPIHLGNMNTPQALEFDRALRKWVGEQTVDDVVRLLIDNGVPCAKVQSSKDVADHPHYQARQVHIEWDDGMSGRVKGLGVVPKFTDTPGKIWRGAVSLGHDNELVYGKLLGVETAELEQLQRDEVV